MKIASNSGKWFMNHAMFPMIDAESGTRFEPGEPTKAQDTAWIAGQPTIKPCADPTRSDAEQAEEGARLLLAEAEARKAQEAADAKLTADTLAAQAKAAAAAEGAKK